MADVVFVLVTLVFFAGCALYVRLCDRIIGPDPAEPELDLADQAPHVDLLEGTAEVGQR